MRTQPKCLKSEKELRSFLDGLAAVAKYVECDRLCAKYELRNGNTCNIVITLHSEMVSAEQNYTLLLFTPVDGKVWNMFDVASLKHINTEHIMSSIGYFEHRQAGEQQ